MPNGAFSLIDLKGNFHYGNDDKKTFSFLYFSFDGPTMYMMKLFSFMIIWTLLALSIAYMVRASYSQYLTHEIRIVLTIINRHELVRDSSSTQIIVEILITNSYTHSSPENNETHSYIFHKTPHLSQAKYF